MLKESFRPRIFLNTQLFLSGYRYRPHVSVEHGIWIRNFLNLLSREEIFESVMNPEIVWTLNPDSLLSTDVTRSSPVLYREYSRRSEQRKISGYVWTGKFAAWFESGYVWTWRFKEIAYVASVSVWFRSKEIPRKGTFGFDRARNETRAKKWKRGEGRGNPGVCLQAFPSFLPIPLPALLLAPLFSRSLTLVPRFFFLNRTETLATQARKEKIGD